MLSGYKSYLFAGLLFLGSLAYSFGWVEQDVFLTLAGVFGAGGVAGLRAAVEKK